MLIAPDAPKLGVGDVNTARDLVEQLPARNLRPVILLERGKQAGLLCVGARDQPLVLLHIELTVGLQLGRALDKRRRRDRSVLLDLVVRDPYAATLVLLLE